jgi:high affinity Mn2+ porin
VKPLLSLIASLLWTTASVCAQTPTILPHGTDARWWLSGQANVILQEHGRFTSPYSGDNSLRPDPEHATSRLLTLYTGVALRPGTEILFDVESAGGRGISDALGLAGFTNLDVVRNPTLGSAPYIARLMVHQVIALGAATKPSERGPFSLGTQLPSRRIELRAGKFSLADWFDVNAVGSDSHLQFTNWTADNNGAYDYAADTRGYTVGVEAEYQDADWGIRFAEAVMPTVANGIDYDWHLGRARSENLEVEMRRGLVPGRDGVIRVLGYANHANMGSYTEALDLWRRTGGAAPSIEASRRPGRIKYGVGLGLEQTIAEGVRGFARWGWNEGRNESFAYTEVNRSTSGGAEVAGAPWSRPHDKVGAAVIVNELSPEHRAYLAAGGLGFLLGDGKLTYGSERIFEMYYTAQLARGIFGSFDLQWINNPGYNQDRGPVVVPGARLHLEF